MQKGNRMFTPDITNWATNLSFSQRKRFYIRWCQNHLKEGHKKTLDKFDIIRKLETIRTQLTTIKKRNVV
jgi:hypothetical protein